MRYRQMGQSGLTVSVVGLGGNNFGRRCDVQQTRAIIDAAQEAGVTFVDTAEMYGGDGLSESFLGEALKGRRHEFVVATKFGHQSTARPGMALGSRRYVRQAIEGSLKRLQTDYIDLYYLHTPDPITPVEETLAALSELIDEGKVRYAGSSNVSGWQLADADWTARSKGLNRFVAVQNRYNLLERAVEQEVVPACERFQVGLVPFFPLASGLLTGKYRRGEPPPEGTRLAARPGALKQESFDVVDKLEGYARDRHASLLQVAIGGLAAMPTVTSVIAGATSPDQVKANASAGDWTPTPGDLNELREVLT